MSAVPEQGSNPSPARELWRLGDYSQVVNDVVGGLGPVLVEACGVTAGQRVIDVAAGTGSVAIPAAERGAEVVALDITPGAVRRRPARSGAPGCRDRLGRGRRGAAPL